jgi:secreted trypsin-like serine protease
MKGTASGDSGGPLQVKYNGTWYQVGITSYGGGSTAAVLNQHDYPGVYMRVSSYCSWIDTTTNGDVKCIGSIALLNKNLLILLFLWSICYKIKTS